MVRITVIGAGYVGLVSAACFAELGHKVHCVEKNPSRLGKVLQGEMPIYEAGLDELVCRHSAFGRLKFSDDHASAMRDADFVFLAVDTPARNDGRANTDNLFAAAETVFRYGRPGVTLVTKSTVPPGTGDLLAEMAQEQNPSVHVASNPEFLRQGTAVEDFFHPDRIVVGASNEMTAQRVALLYEGLDAPVVLCTRRSAEMAKYASNSLLATRVSFVNELAAIAEAVGADIGDVARIVGLDPRIGPRYLSPGLGWGGSCLPKDVSALRAVAGQNGTLTRLLDAVADVNDAQCEIAIRKLEAGIGTLAGKRIAVLGLAFKPETDDIRGAPAIRLIHHLLERKAQVRAHDPLAIEATRAILPDVTYCEEPYDAVDGCDAVLVATEWRLYRKLDWTRIGRSMRTRHVVDGRNALDQDELENAGFTYECFGRPGTLIADREADLDLDPVG